MSKYLNLETARKLINFAGISNDDSLFMKNLGESQLDGAVSLFNKIADHGIGYIADEVGMGKTYIALGVVTLMRYFNPSLRVLYIVPKQNLITKWMHTDYPNFLKNNFLVSDYRVKCDNHGPAVKGTECKNLVDLIEKSSTGYYADFFIKGSAFSFPINDDEVQRQLQKLKGFIPSFQIPTLDGNENNEQQKRRVKEIYADTINKILPDFDLIVVDEAHNYRKSQESSSRNLVLSRILGTYKESDTACTRVKRVRNALLLSATPFESSIDELQNQLRIFGKEDVLSGFSEERKFEELSKFMVRRLNTLSVQGKECTRNMYRREYRKDAAIEIKSTKSKLVVALMQKKVGELLHDMKGQYQTGMLASFESYIPSTQSIDVEFDGDQEEKNSAKDASIIRVISDSYVKELNKPALPHPKMDETVNDLFPKAFNENKKQIVFVRRVQSVSDLKVKFDAQYDLWLKEYIGRYLNNDQALQSLNELIDQFTTFKNKDQLHQLVDESAEIEVDDEDVNTDDSTFLNFFFRGKNTPKIEGVKLQVTTFKKYLTDKTDKNGLKEYLLVDGSFRGRFFEEIEKCVFGKTLDEMVPDKNKMLFIRELYYSLMRLGHGLVDLYVAYLNGGDWVEQIVAILKSQEANEKSFSTFQQIKDCYENIDIIIKTNFNDYEKHIGDIRRYIVRKLNPMEPIIGASGLGGNDKTVTALKFRMPGYPMILISTDVLQEGEDLHTFCDSIVHYGLSSNPIALEQKTGRVDRVGSMAQRNLAKYDGHSLDISFEKIIEDAGVKVSFPFIKESFEYFQVRNLSQRLNRFLGSLHEIELQNSDAREDATNVEDGMSSREEIEELITSKLTSPLAISNEEIPLKDVLPLEGPNLEVQKHIQFIMKSLHISRKEYELTPSANPNEQVITVKSNSTLDEIIEYEDFDDLVEQLVRVGGQRYHRALLKKYEVTDGRITVSFNTQMMIGDHKITQEEELQELIERSQSGSLSTLNETVNLGSLYSEAIRQYPLNKQQRFIRNHSVTTEYENETVTFHFKGGSSDFPFERKQVVHLSQKDGYIIFQSKCFNLDNWSGSTDKEKMLVRYTLERNPEIDIVEFIVTGEHFIEGRIVHPIRNMQPKEFLFNAYILACECDQLEMILSDLDDDQF